MRRSSQPSRKPSFNWPLLYAGVTLTTLATMVLELALTRIFSVVFYYHFAFLAISIALFGLGAGGLFSYAFRGRSERLLWKLGVIAAINSGMVVLMLGYILSRKGKLDSGTLAMLYLMSALPFFLAGTVISTAIAETVERVERVYFFDLLGAAGGCLLLVPLLNFVGGPNTVIGGAILFAASAAVWFTMAGSLRGRAAMVAIALALVVLIVVNAKHPVLDVRYAKGERLAGEFFVKWNSFSRIALAKDGPNGGTSIYIDADASSRISDLDLDHLTEQARQRLLDCAPGLAYVLRPGAKTLIFGPGGGWDVARALVSGSPDITGVEVNPIIANTVMQERFASLSRDLYARPEVRIVVGDGRSFLRRNADQFEVLQIPLSYTWNSALAGAHAFTETNLFTREAFDDYLGHLNEDGVMSFTYWAFTPPRESLRLVTLAINALAGIGEFTPWKHVVVVRAQVDGHPQDTVLVSRSLFSAKDLETVRRAAGNGGMEIVYLPGDTADSAFATLLRGPSPRRYVADYPYDVSPVDDNRPFFYYTARLRDVFRLWRSDGVESERSSHAVPMLFRLLGVSLLATAIVVLLPPLFRGGRIPRRRGVGSFLWYFVFIGVGYILIQVALIQKFVLFLEHPTYAITVIIFSMLVSSSLGSFYSRRLAGSSEKSLMGALATVALLVALLAVLIPPLTSTGAGWPLPAKALAAVLLIAPAGFVMGIAFPSGLARLEQRDPPSVRWAWALNAAASVLGSALAIFLAIHLGLRETLLVGGVMYLCALISLNRSRQLAGAAREG